MIFPKDGKERERYPMYDGLLKYFPDALAGVAVVSKVGSEKHNPGEPMRWARDKSRNHGDKIIRHLMDAEEIDPDTGLPEAVHMAWRALALAQEIMEKHKNGEKPRKNDGMIIPVAGCICPVCTDARARSQKARNNADPS